jgi:hypothetical protein
VFARLRRFLPFGSAECALLIASLASFGIACCSEQAASHNAARGASALQPDDNEAPLRGLPEPALRGETFRRGVVIGPLAASDDEQAFRRRYSRQLDRAVAIGATDVTLVVRWMQPDLRAIECAPYDSVHDDVLTWLVDQAKRRKLRVGLSPELAIEKAQGEHAQRALKPSSWERWWWSYRRLALHYARVSAMRKVSQLTIGTELTSTEGQTDRWRALIKEIRKIYKGKLTYVASAESFDKVAFWDALDVLSIAVEQRDPRSEAQLLDRLSPLRKRLERSAPARELGYQLVEAGCGAAGARSEAMLDAHAEPRVSKRASDEAKRAQPRASENSTLCQRALFQSFGDASHLEGVFVRGESEASAESAGEHSGSEVVRHWYRRSKS